MFPTCSCSVTPHFSCYPHFLLTSPVMEEKKATIFSFRKCWSSTNANYLEIKLTKEKQEETKRIFKAFDWLLEHCSTCRHSHFIPTMIFRSCDKSHPHPFVCDQWHICEMTSWGWGYNQERFSFCEVNGHIWELNKL